MVCWRNRSPRTFSENVEEVSKCFALSTVQHVFHLGCLLYLSFLTYSLYLSNRSKINLNEISHDSAMGLVTRVLNMGVLLTQVLWNISNGFVLEHVQWCSWEGPPTSSPRSEKTESYLTNNGDLGCVSSVDILKSVTWRRNHLGEMGNGLLFRQPINWWHMARRNEFD